MLEKLKKIQTNSYSPYSNFRVAAIVIDGDGKEFSGVNIENSSYPASICAERVALLKCVSEKNKPTELHLLTDSKEVGTPCGICRQVMLELMNLDSKVHMYSLDGKVITKTVKELIPLGFSGDSL